MLLNWLRQPDRQSIKLSPALNCHCSYAHAAFVVNNKFDAISRNRRRDITGARIDVARVYVSESSQTNSKACVRVDTLKRKLLPLAWNRIWNGKFKGTHIALPSVVTFCSVICCRLLTQDGQNLN
jgi:hypothetical protein